MIKINRNAILEVEDDILLSAATGRPGELNFLDTPVDTSSSSVRHPRVKPTFTGIGLGHDRASRKPLTARGTALQGAERDQREAKDITTRPYGTTVVRVGGHSDCVYILQLIFQLVSLKP